MGTTAVLLVSLGLVAGCTTQGRPPAPDDAAGRTVAAAVDPVEVLVDEAGWRAGVHDHPLAPGESLLFDFGTPVTPTWTMDGVGYDLVLRPVDAAGEPLGRLAMPACPDDCADLSLAGVVSRWWVEHRPMERSRQ